jgi:hypothetical protein
LDPFSPFGRLSRLPVHRDQSKVQWFKDNEPQVMLKEEHANWLNGPNGPNRLTGKRIHIDFYTITDYRFNSQPTENRLKRQAIKNKEPNEDL